MTGTRVGVTTAGHHVVMPAHESPPALAETTKPRRFRTGCHCELLSCGVAGHELWHDARRLRAQDVVVAREAPDRLR